MARSALRPAVQTVRSAVRGFKTTSSQLKNRKPSQSRNNPHSTKDSQSDKKPPSLVHYYSFADKWQSYPYAHINAWQQKMVEDVLAYKAAVSKQESPDLPPVAPMPTVLTFTPQAVYTRGRREKESLTEEQMKALKEPMMDGRKLVTADVVDTMRGGLTTFHGRGQLVIYPILDLRAIRTKLWPDGLSVRCYVNLLEEATIKTLAHHDIHAVRTENPGVWLTDGPKGERKIAALGLHLRRNVTSFGVALNIRTKMEWFDRITACGLEGKGTTSIVNEKPELLYIRLRPLAKTWVDEFTASIWGEEGFASHSLSLHAPYPEILHQSRFPPLRKVPAPGKTDHKVKKVIESRRKEALIRARYVGSKFPIRYMVVDLKHH